MTKTDVRELCLGILLEVTGQKEFSHVALRNVLDKYQYLEKQERAFLTRVTEGTLERMLELDHIINQFSKVKVNKMKPVIRNILRMSVYQIKYMDSVPDSAVCNEAVKLAKKKGFSSLSGFVNGVLRSIVRGLGEVQYPPKSRVAEHLSVRYSMPQWLTERWLAAYGRELTEEMLEGFLQATDTTVRIHTGRTAPAELKEQLEAEGIETAEVQGLPYALRIRKFDSLKRIPAFREGLFSVQDISSMLVAEAADPKEGDFCLDVCAAPGGKATHLAEKLNGTGLVEARDLTDYKVRLMEENIERSGLTNIRTKVFDATRPDEAMMAQADVVLADLPCSGLGVLGKKPDIKYRATPESLVSLAGLQRQILGTIWQYVKPGGTLVYSTCTINPEENEENVRWFLQKYPFEPAELPEVLGAFAGEESRKSGMCQLLPGKQGNDGFFIAKLRRKDK